MKIKIEDILLWIIIALLIGLAIWKLFGSPTDTASIIAVVLFVASSTILLWRALFRIDKKTSLGFMRIKNDMNSRFNEINNRFSDVNHKINIEFNKVNARLDNIEKILTKRR